MQPGWAGKHARSNLTDGKQRECSTCTIMWGATADREESLRHPAPYVQQAPPYLVQLVMLLIVNQVLVPATVGTIQGVGWVCVCGGGGGGGLL